MGSHFITVYGCDIRVLTHLMTQTDQQAIQAFLARTSKHAAEPDQISALEKVVHRTFDADPETGQSDDAHELIRAFELVCKEVAEEQQTFEVYEDPDETPTLWDFIFEGESAFDLPLSRYGVPAETRHNIDRTKHFLCKFADDLEKRSFNTQFFKEDALRCLIELLQTNIAKNLDTFVFYEQ